MHRARGRADGGGQEPGSAGAGAPVAARGRPGVPVWSEVELAARMLHEPDRRRHRHQRQDHHHRAASARCCAPGGLAVRGGRATSAARSPSCAGRVDAGRLDRLRALELPARGHRPASLPGGGGAEPHPRPSRPARRHWTSTSAASCGSSRTRRAGDIAVLNGDDPLLRAAEPARRRAAGVVRAAADRRVRSTGSTRACAASTTSKMRWRRPRPPGPPASGRCGDRRRTAQRFDPPPHRLEPVAAGAACEWVNDSKATNPDATIKALTAFDSARAPHPRRLAQGRLVRCAGAGGGVGSGGP